MHANKDKLKPTEEQPGIGWINKTHFLLGNLIIDIETMRVSFCMHLSTYDDYFLTLSQVIADLNDLAGYELCTKHFIDNRWPHASFIIIYDPNVKELITFRLQTRPIQVSAASVHAPGDKGQCKIIYRSESHKHGSLGKMQFDGKQCKNNILCTNKCIFVCITVIDGLNFFSRKFTAEVDCVYYDHETNTIFCLSAISDKGK